MKKKILLAVSMVALGTAVAYAGTGAGTGIQGSRHDMTVVAGAGADSQQRVCAFCHTPHHADQSGNLDYNPLWAHAVTTQTFIPYASLTLNAAIDPASFLAGPSKLCMSCHDGVIAVDQHYGSVGGTYLMSGDGFGQYAVGTGGDLSNDHPIGFDYTAVANGGSGISAAAGTGTPTAAQDNYIKLATSPYIDNIDPATSVRTPTANGIKISDRLFGGSIFTCATCHDVHNAKTINAGGGTNGAPVVALTDTKNYFLLGGQVGSAICLSCHIK